MGRAFCVAGLLVVVVLDLLEVVGALASVFELAALVLVLEAEPVVSVVPVDHPLPDSLSILAESLHLSSSHFA